VLGHERGVQANVRIKNMSGNVFIAYGLLLVVPRIEMHDLINDGPLGRAQKWSQPVQCDRRGQDALLFKKLKRCRERLQR
jgi:hypothetical protein